MENLTNQIEKLRRELSDRFASLPFPYALSQNISLAQQIDHTRLQPDAMVSQIEQLCREAIEYHFFSVCIHPTYLALARDVLNESNVKMVTVVGFPTGASRTETKIFETLDAIDAGANEIDMVLNIGKLKSGLLDDVYQDIALVAGQADVVPVKVILETCLLTQEEKITACMLAQMAGAAMIKTSTGFSLSGATIEDVALMKKVVGDSIGIKASGGIRNLQTARAMIDAGAARLGASQSVAIMKEYNGQSQSR